MTKKELQERLQELELQVQDLTRDLQRSEAQFNEAHQTIRNIVTVSWQAAKGDYDDAKDAIEVIKMLSDNAWLLLEEWNNGER